MGCSLLLFFLTKDIILHVNHVIPTIKLFRGMVDGMPSTHLISY